MMGVMLIYKNDIGTVEMSGDSTGNVRICSIEGLGPVIKEYNAAVYSGQTGQRTISSQILPRCITVGLEVIGKNILPIIQQALRTLSREGTLYIKASGSERRIECNQVQIPDITRILKGQISTFAVQFVCDNPYFEDGEDIVVPLYKRTKLLATPFNLPCMFGEIVLEADINVSDTMEVEPIITMYYPKATDGTERIVITNRTTGASICLDYAPCAEDTVVIDVKNRNITSSKTGNIINYLSNDTFLGDFVLTAGRNVISVDLGDLTAEFTAQCRYSSFYGEAVIV